MQRCVQRLFSPHRARGQNQLPKHQPIRLWTCLVQRKVPLLPPSLKPEVNKQPQLLSYSFDRVYSSHLKSASATAALQINTLAKPRKPSKTKGRNPSHHSIDPVKSLTYVNGPPSSRDRGHSPHHYQLKETLCQPVTAVINRWRSPSSLCEAVAVAQNCRHRGKSAGPLQVVNRINARSHPSSRIGRPSITRLYCDT